MEGPYCCCCGKPRSWSLAIAWLQIVVNSMGVLGAVNGFVAILFLVIYATEQEITGDDVQDREATERVAGVFSIIGPLILVVIFFLLIVIFLANIVFGVILLRGVQQNNVELLRKWAIYTMVSILFYIIFTVIISFFSSSWVWHLIVMLVLVSLFVFSILIVRKLIIQIERTEDDMNEQRRQVLGQARNSVTTSTEQYQLQSQSQSQSQSQPQSQQPQSIPSPATPGFGFNPFLN